MQVGSNMVQMVNSSLFFMRLEDGDIFSKVDKESVNHSLFCYIYFVEFLKLLYMTDFEKFAREKNECNTDGCVLKTYAGKNHISWDRH